MAFLKSIPFGTHPRVVHAPGEDMLHPYWPEVRDRFFATATRCLGAPRDLTILTWNNGAPGMGVLERSLDHLGIPYRVAGHGIADWVNSRDKPRLTCEMLEAVDTPYVLGADSGDVVVVDDPAPLCRLLDERFGCDLVFNAGRINWPNLKEFKDFEDARPEAGDSQFRYLNAGVWIGRTRFCREFFAEVARTPPLARRPASEQGLVKQLFPRYWPRVQLDYRCEMFQNLGSTFQPVLEIHD
jgi:hypothetical protein